MNDAQNHDILAVVPDQNQGQEAGLPAQAWKKSNSAQAWDQVVNTMTKYDEKMVGGWKEELGNLLIFVRPFSHLPVRFALHAWHLPGFLRTGWSLLCSSDSI